MNTYIVSGRPRSGTSMMMRACAIGGLRSMYKDSIRELIEAERAFDRNNYVPNPDGFYENPILDYTNGDTDKLVSKVLAQQLQRLPTVHNLRYKIVFMIRPDDEVCLSFRRAFGDSPINILTIEDAKELAIRSDFDVTYVNYHDVVNDPIKEFTKLEEAGWPINVAQAATVPTPDLYRNRIEK